MSGSAKVVNSRVKGPRTNAEAFAAWADVYDTQQNPLLTLEERYLSNLLPEIQGKDVLDVGCGTGRWLAPLSARGPRTLVGVDISPEMLRKASAKHIPNVQLLVSSCTELRAYGASIDLALASFLLSYVPDVAVFARELARVLREGSDLFLSDVHPETAARFHWKRTFRSSGQAIELETKRWPIAEVRAAFESAGFRVGVQAELGFGAVEREIFAANQKLESFVAVEGYPAIYLLHLRKRQVSGLDRQKRNARRRSVLLQGARCAVAPESGGIQEVWIENGRITRLQEQPSESESAIESLDLSGHLLLPGLINAHDHLEFALFPNLGRGSYPNAAEWAFDIHENDAATIAAHLRVPKRVRLWWGGVRNLLSGVTTVCHHNPMDPFLKSEGFPVRVFSCFGWEHSLRFGKNVRAAHRCTPKNQPFIIHACEGIDDESRAELRELDELGVLNRRTALVHGRAIDAAGIALMNERGAALITCPSSNVFLFGSVLSPELLRSISRVALGSDSPLTAKGDLLDEIRFAARAYGSRPSQLYSFVTDSPAKILRLRHGEGSIRAGAYADLIAIQDRPGTPAEILSALRSTDIEMVLISGRVQLASAPIFERLSPEERVGLEPLSVDGRTTWLRAPISSLLDECEDVLGKGAVRLGGKPVCRARV